MSNLAGGVDELQVLQPHATAIGRSLGLRSAASPRLAIADGWSAARGPG